MTGTGKWDREAEVFSEFMKKFTQSYFMHYFKLPKNVKTWRNLEINLKKHKWCSIKYGIKNKNQICYFLLSSHPWVQAIRHPWIKRSCPSMTAGRILYAQFLSSAAVGYEITYNVLCCEEMRLDSILCQIMIQ